MTIWFSADTHYGHKNIIELTKRPFKNLDDMNQTLIDNHNKCVKPTDEWYFLGDFSLCKAFQTLEILSQLNGIKYCIQGNHHSIMKNKKVASHFEWVKDYFMLKVKDERHKDGKQLIVLCHYPFFVWDRADHGTWMLHGHCHGNLLKRNEPILDVGVDNHKFKPVSYEQLKIIMVPYLFQARDHHQKVT